MLLHRAMTREPARVGRLLAATEAFLLFGQAPRALL